MKAASNAEQTSKVLCFLSDDWKNRPSESKRSKDETLTYRFGISVLPYSWAISEFRGTAVFHQSFATSFADLAPLIRTVGEEDPLAGMQRVKESLEKATGKQIVITPQGNNDIEKAIDFGRRIDEFFLVDFSIHDEVRERIFGYTAQEDEE